VAAAEVPWIRVQLSNGRQYEVHPDDVAELQRRDPQARNTAVNHLSGLNERPWLPLNTLGLPLTYNRV